ncbi:MAG: hypothetical protein CMK89_15505 [Pseudomonadales bacterium]|nr:hypothetical protein [Pseudomonadales bacterium]RLT93953.1 MAG: hypothetical protein D9N11_15720 [Ketobacter sp.]
MDTNRKTFLIALSIFVIPFLAALLLHKTGLYTSVGTTNRGELISPPAAFDAIELSDQNKEPITPDSLKKKWWMVYVMPNTCNEACENSLYQIRQIHAALGPEQNRVATMLIATHPLDAKYQTLIEQEFPHLRVAYTEDAELESWFSETNNQPLQTRQTGYIYLVDTMGAVFMYYPTYEDEQESILKGRDMLKDLQKVLKLSKIG